MFIHEHPMFQTPEYRRKIELDPVTSQLLRGARGDLKQYRLDAALGVTTDLDKEGIEYYAARLTVEEGHMHPSVRERVYRDLDALITDYVKDYPQEEAIRPYNIQSGVTTILDGLKEHPIRGRWRRTTHQRLAARKYGTVWRDLLQSEKQAKNPPTPSHR